MNLTILTPPQFEPVSLGEVYESLRIDEAPGEDQQAHLERLITTARREVEHLTQRSLVRQQLRLSTGSFNGLSLLRPPTISVELVQYYDAGNVLQTVDPENWYLTDDLVPQIELAGGMNFSTYNRRDAVRVTYWAGYPVDGSPGTNWEEVIANVPSEAKDAILIGVQLLYEAMDPTDRDRLERARAALINGLKVYEVV